MSALSIDSRSTSTLEPPAERLPGETTVLIVDDNLIDRRVAGRIVERQNGWKVAFARNGAEALLALERDAPRIVLTDLQMPEMDGLALVKEIRAKHSQIPVVLMTANGSEKIATEALQSGAASYVPKRDLAEELASTLKQVVAAARIDGQHQGLLACLTQRESRFWLGNDPALIAGLVALLQEDLLAMQLCDATGAIRVGMALEQALLNALYHGTLEVGMALRRNDEDYFRQMVEQRRVQAPYRNRRIRVLATITRDEATYVVLDQGPGFDPSKLPNPTDQENLNRSSGRGVLLIRTFMDRVTFSPTGNQITMVKRREGR
jgi:CheY-like chemotaxis protein